MTKRQSIYVTVGGIVLFLGYLMVGMSREMARWERESQQRQYRQPHAVYLRDASGDCVALYGLPLRTQPVTGITTGGLVGHALDPRIFSPHQQPCPVGG